MQDIKIFGPAPGDSVSISGRSDEPIPVNVTMSDKGVDVRVAVKNQDNIPLAANIAGANGQPIEAKATVAGDSARPIAANLGGSVTANVGGTDSPLKIAPFQIEHLRLRPDIMIDLRLFGLLVGSIHITGNASLSN